MNIFYCELSLAEGFEVSLRPNKFDRLVGGREVSTASGIKLFQLFQWQKISCWHCGCEADRWIVSKHQNDMRSKPVLNLYAPRHGKLVLMTQDHIIPKSLGGVDAIENLRPGCEICNGARGSNMNKADKEFMRLNPQLIDAERAACGQKRAHKHRKGIQT